MKLLTYTIAAAIALTSVCWSQTALSAEGAGPAQVKEVCKDKMDKKGKPVISKDGKAVQECKKIKVHKKLEGTAVPPAKK